MISVTKLRNGVNFEDGDDPWRVLDYKHTHLSRGSGTIRVKCRNLRTGQVLTKTFKSGDKIEDISVVKRIMQYLYADGNEYVFMDPETYEQMTIGSVVMDGQEIYLKEGEDVHVLFWDEVALGLSLPPKMVFEVAEAAPGEKGDSASNVYKEAVLENGLRVKVPLFVNSGDQVRVDTRDGSYIERA